MTTGAPVPRRDPGPADPPGPWAGPMRGRLTLLLVVAGAGVGVALGSADVELLLPASDGENLGSVRLVGGLVAVMGLVALLLQRGRIRSDARTLLTAGGIMVLLVGVAALAPYLALDIEPEPIASADEPTFVEPSGPRLTGELAGRGGVLATGQAEGARRPMVAREVERQVAEDPARFDRDLLGPALKALLAALLLGAFLWALRFVWRPPSGRRGLEWTLEDPADGDPSMVGPEGAPVGPTSGGGRGAGPRARSEVTVSYHQFLEALAGAGPEWVRRPHEAPFEHLNRVMEALHLHPDPPAKLAALHVAAEFGATRVTEDEERLAEEALREALDHLERGARP